MLDGGPYRAPRPAEKRTVVRPAAQQQPEDLQMPDEQPRPVHRAAPPHHAVKNEKFPRRLVIIIAAVIITIVLCVAGWLAWSSMRPAAAAIDSSKYQAVFFTNGQVYFGKLADFDAHYMKLTEVFYLQTKDAANDSQNPQQTAKNSSNDVQLIKLGNEIHGPTDEMIISKDQVLFFENLKSDGKVSDSIDKYKNK